AKNKQHPGSSYYSRKHPGRSTALPPAEDRQRRGERGPVKQLPTQRRTDLEAAKHELPSPTSRSRGEFDRLEKLGDNILPLCNQVQRLTNQMEQGVSSPTKSVKMETGVSQSEQTGEPMHKEDSVDIFPQVVAHEMKLRTFSGTPDNLDQINVGEWIAEAKRNIRLLGYKGRGSVNYNLKFLTGPAQKRVEKLAWSDSCDSEGVLAVLKDTYGENLTLGELHFRLYQRTQGVLENVWTYSDVLETLHEEIVKVAPTQVVSRSDNLKEVFLKGLRDQGLQSGLRWYLRGRPGMSSEELVQVAAEESKKTTKQTIKEKNLSKGVVTAINECSPVVKEVGETLNPHGSVPQESGVEKMLAELRVDIQAVKTDQVQIKRSPEGGHLLAPEPRSRERRSTKVGLSAAKKWSQDHGSVRNCWRGGKWPTLAVGSPPVGVEQVGWSHTEWSKDKLVGKTPVTAVKIGGVLVTSLLDSVSEVSLVSETVYRRYFEYRGVGLHSPEGLVLGQYHTIPYLGYMLIGVLVRKGEQSSASQAPGLIGMNVLRSCREVLVKDFGPQYVDCSIIKGNIIFSKCFQEIESIHRWQQKDQVGFASSTRWKPTRIPANCRQAISIYIRSLRRCPKLEVLIEPMQGKGGCLPTSFLSLHTLPMWPMWVILACGKSETGMLEWLVGPICVLNKKQQ
ncbi:hypothetical protein Hamer_G028768, partial [Homarus americanus]